MLTEIYIEALLADREAADEIWEALDAGEIDNRAAWALWRIIDSTFRTHRSWVTGKKIR